MVLITSISGHYTAAVDALDLKNDQLILLKKQIRINTILHAMFINKVSMLKNIIFIRTVMVITMD